MSLTLSGLSSMATKDVLAELTEAYTRERGVRAQIQSLGGVDAARRVREGETLDVVVLASGVVRALESEGHIVSGGGVDIARSQMVVAVADDAPRPVIDQEEALKAAVLQAGGIGYSTGPSGDHLLKLLQHWGIAEAVAPRLRRAPVGTPVAALLARGEAELGFQQHSELLGQPGVHILGPLPASVQGTTIFTAAVATTSPRPTEARALVDYLAAPQADEVKRRFGMEPANDSMT